MKFFSSLIALAFFGVVSAATAETLAIRPGRPGEFRAAWVHTVKQEKRFVGKSPQQITAELTRLVDTFKRTGFNAVIFQVRSEGDAFYPSKLEPWSRFLTGVQGRSLGAGFDPLKLMISLCHARNMECHAWVNPYRMCVTRGSQLAPNHLYRRHPEWFVAYDKGLYLDPGLPESRNWIRTVVRDIASRYPVDAIHMDDYFYPYPVKGQVFDDNRSFAKYAAKLGVNPAQPGARGEFRRRSVNALIKGLHEDIRAVRPKARFGISPFGIYRNAKSWKGGSATDGTQCYDDLYADVLLWARSGWVDYLVPQLYWEIGHPRADYTRLCSWWAAAVPQSCKLYIGISIERSLDGKADLISSNRQFTRKISQARNDPRIDGLSFWYGYQVEANSWRVGDYLRQRVFQGGTK